MNLRAKRRINALKEQGGRCFYCGEVVPDSKATLDHFYPRGHSLRVLNGGHRNVAACRPCNSYLGDAWVRIKQLWSKTEMEMS